MTSQDNDKEWHAAPNDANYVSTTYNESLQEHVNGNQTAAKANAAPGTPSTAAQTATAGDKGNSKLLCARQRTRR